MLVVWVCDLVMDFGFQVYSNNGSFFIIIEDINDNVFYFLFEDKIFVIIFEFVLFNWEVVFVWVRDDDLGNNGFILFFIF